jgi:hypothetical protein
VNTRYYWKCQTNDLFTSAKCDNNLTITESDLLEAIRGYLSSMIQDREQLIQEAITALEKGREKPQKALGKAERQKRIKQLQFKKEKYQEMYAADVMTMTELKEKTSYINQEIECLSAQLEQASKAERGKNASVEELQAYTEAIEAFLSFQTVTNGDLRKLISRIVVDREGEIKIYLRHFSDLTTA